jgi:predicted PurR-regulated permease PerM
MVTTAHSPRRDDQPGDSPRALVVWTVAVVALAVVLLAALFVVRHVLLLIYVAALLAIGLSPFVRWIERQEVLAMGRRRVPRWVVILVLYAVGMAIVTWVAGLVLPPLVTQSRELAASTPALIERAQDFLARHGVGRMSFDQLAPALPTTSDALGTVLGTVTGLLGGAFGLVTIVILTFYFLVEAEAIVDAWLHLLPRDRRAQARAIAQGVTEKVSAWLVGQLILGVAIGASAGLALMLLRVPFFYVLAILAAIGECIPYAGPFFAGLIATAIAASVSWHLALATGVYYLLQQLVENNLLVPKLMGHQVGLSAAAIIVAVLIGGALLGVMGAVLAVPTAAILQATLQELAPESEHSRDQRSPIK